MRAIVNEADLEPRQGYEITEQEAAGDRALDRNNVWRNSRSITRLSTETIAGSQLLT